MPSRHVIKSDYADSFYHIFASGNGGRALFFDDQDYRMFLGLFHRHLSLSLQRDSIGRPYAHLRGEIEVNAFCVMPNNIHIVIYQHTPGTMTKLMRSIMTSYSRYFNTKYNSSGTVFGGRYKASRIIGDEALIYVSRYVHLQASDWQEYWYSSASVFTKQREAPEWLQPERILRLFSSADLYGEFMVDAEDYDASIEDIKHIVADR